MMITRGDFARSPSEGYTSVINHLQQRDVRLATVIAETTLPPLPEPATPYLSLLRAVVNQQIARSTAQRIWQRLLNQLGSDLAPDQLLLQAEQLQSSGLSRQKVCYLQSIALYAQQHDLSAAALEALSDQQMIQQLTGIHGIGEWTVQMLLIFCLRRPDVLPLEDLMIRRAMQRLYSLEALQGSLLRRELQQIATQWEPYRSSACRYLWSWHSQLTLTN